LGKFLDPLNFTELNSYEGMIWKVPRCCQTRRNR